MGLSQNFSILRQTLLFMQRGTTGAFPSASVHPDRNVALNHLYKLLLTSNNLLFLLLTFVAYQTLSPSIYNWKINLSNISTFSE